MSTLAYLGLGSNLEQRSANLLEAIQRLSAYNRVLRCSNVYETEPWGYTDQPSFLNQVIEVETALFPQSLLTAVKDIETNLGRRPTFHYGPRLIDIDILIYGTETLVSPNLTIPHAQLAYRAFVLAPLAELAPNLIVPELGVSVRSLLDAVDISGIKCYTTPSQEVK